ncbi:MAG: NAD-dependent protein deacetylase [Sandaracinus sp.]
MGIDATRGAGHVRLVQLAELVPLADVDALAALIRGRRVVMLTGAGLSTRSGIPDYRGPETRRRARQPVRFAEYLASESKRARYWARSAVGWTRFSRAEPNAAHHAIAALERRGVVTALLTQNVDRLHHRAGSTSAIELHGALEETRCLGCGRIESRHDVQRRILAENPAFAPEAIDFAPDGDADLDDAVLASFRPPVCAACGGALKPNVVFFGESVPRATVEAAYAAFDAAEVLVVVGSSLAVFSGHRFARRAVDRGMPIAIVNLGECRADPIATLRVEADCTRVLPALASALE